MLKKTVLETAMEKALDEVKAAKQRKKKVKKFTEDFSDEINRIQDGATHLAEWLIDVTIDTNSQSLDISYAGDKHVLKSIFSTYRKLGYKTTKRPAENVTEFTSYWSHPDSDMRIWLKFTSTVCKRVKTGTKMVQQDVYETVCE
jgi:hypothetical protein